MNVLKKGQVQGVNKGGIAEEHKNCSHICPSHCVFKQPCGLPGRHERPVYADEYLVRIVDGREPRLARLSWEMMHLLLHIQGRVKKGDYKVMGHVSKRLHDVLMHSPVFLLTYLKHQGTFFERNSLEQHGRSLPFPRTSKRAITSKDCRDRLTDLDTDFPIDDHIPSSCASTLYRMKYKTSDRPRRMAKMIQK